MQGAPGWGEAPICGRLHLQQPKRPDEGDWWNHRCEGVLAALPIPTESGTPATQSGLCKRPSGEIQQQAQSARRGLPRRLQTYILPSRVNRVASTAQPLGDSP